MEDGPGSGGGRLWVRILNLAERPIDLLFVLVIGYAHLSGSHELGTVAIACFGVVVLLFILVNIPAVRDLMLQKKVSAVDASEAEALGRLSRDPHAPASAGPRRDGLRIKRLTSGDGEKVHTALLRCIGADVDEAGISPAETFEKWLRASGTFYRGIEVREIDDITGFYSVMALKDTALRRLANAELHHDELGQDDFVPVDPIAGGAAEEPWWIFILDFEIPPDRSRHYVMYLLLDLMTICHALFQVPRPPEGIVALAATGRGGKFAGSLRLTTRREYRPLEYDGWELASATRTEIEQNGLLAGFGGKLGELLRPAYVVNDHIRRLMVQIWRELGPLRKPEA